MTHSHAYVPTLMKTAVSLYLRSLVCYTFMREYLNLLHLKTVKNYFSTTDSPGELHECENVIIPFLAN